MRFGVGCAGGDGTIVISGGPGVAPVTTRFTLIHDVAGMNYWLTILISGALALIFVIVMIAIRRSVLSETVQTGPGWSFNDSWLTNITALGAILGTVLASAGFLPDVLPGVSTGGFTGLSLLFGGLVVTAPIVYAAASKWQFAAQSPTDTSPATLVSPGRVWGVVVAAGFTLWGVFGELATMVDLTVSTNSGGLAKAFVIAALGTAAGIATWYAVAFAIGVSEESKIGQPISHIRVKSGTL